MKLLRQLSKPFVIFVERFYPNPFVFVILLTFFTFFLVLAATDHSLGFAINAWGNGLSKLLTFMAQLCITLVAAHALAHTDLASRILKAIATLANSRYSAYFLVALISGIANLLAWSLGLIVGALMARQVAIESSKKGLKVHYPLLVASAYAGFVIWHMGYSSSAALFVATPDHILEGQIGIIPVTETIFSSYNIILALLALTAISLICPLMHPDDEEIIVLDKAIIERQEAEHFEVKSEAIENIAKKSIGQILDSSRVLTLLLGGLLLVFLIQWFREKGLNLNLNIVNWTFLALGLLLARNVNHFIGLIRNASSSVGPILLQYPFYAGIMGLLAGCGLIEILSDYFVRISSPDTLTFFSFLSAGLINIMVPSGGGQWAIQGPVFIEAAQKLDVDYSLIVMSIAYGDQWTNMIQPFWTIPLLAIAGLSMRKIMGYTFVILIITFIIFGGGLLILGSG